jgi:hypothetical protein
MDGTTLQAFRSFSLALTRVFAAMTQHLCRQHSTRWHWVMHQARCIGELPSLFTIPASTEKLHKN